jgi:glycosyltransferase involved in cell wall biosynthesis
MTSPLLIRPTFDVAFVAGERGVDFAQRLGFAHERIIRGLYTCDHDRFAAVADARGGAAPQPAFVFVGRLVRSKGIDVLAEGYRRYRTLVDDPWPLLVGGTGDGAATLRGSPGVDLLGFVQPNDLPDLLGRAGCLVLPSRFEPWGVVVHEAAAAGLAVVCTSVCGSATRLVLDGYNGSVVEPGNPDALARALARVSTADTTARAAMSRASRSLAAQYTPQRWATHLVARIRELRALVGLSEPAEVAPPTRAGLPAQQGSTA